MHFDIYDYFLLDRSRNEILISFSRNRGEGKGKEGGRTIFKKKCRRNRALEMLIELSLLLMSILEDGGNYFALVRFGEDCLARMSDSGV